VIDSGNLTKWQIIATNYERYNVLRYVTLLSLKAGQSFKKRPHSPF
jgi:hypothetical protein